MIQEGTFIAAAGEKRNPSDFALWKRSKGGEPSWESPWGSGSECRFVTEIKTVHGLTGIVGESVGLRE